MRGIVSFLLLFSILGCSKTPESEAAKKLGQQPKQMVDKATTDVNKALQQGTEQRQQAEKKE